MVKSAFLIAVAGTAMATEINSFLNSIDRLRNSILLLKNVRQP